MKMKKVLCLMMALLMVLALCACDSGNGPATTTTPDTDPAGYLFTYNGKQIGLNMKMEDVTALIGPADRSNTSDSCAFGGTDTTYYYDSIRITTSDDKGYEWVYEIYLLDDLVATEEGVSVGSTAQQVTEKYGQSQEGSDSLLVYSKGGMKLKFSLKDGKVAAILYTML